MKTIGSLALIILAAAVLTTAPSQAQAATWLPIFGVAHGAQGAGNYKGKKDRHEKPGPMNEKKRKKPSWVSK